MPWSHSSSVGRAFNPCEDGSWGCQGDVVLYTNPGDIIANLFLFINAYACQPAIVPIVAELNRPTRARRLAVVTGAMGLVSVLYMLVAVAGYWTFGNAVDSNVLFNYPQNSSMVLVAFCGIAIDVLSSYPLYMLVTRISVLNLFTELAMCRGYQSPEQRTTLEQQQQEGQCKHFVSSKREVMATLFIMCCTAGVALAVSDLGIVVALTGATGATMVGYIVPGFLYIRLCRDSTALTEPNDEPGNDEEMLSENQDCAGSVLTTAKKGEVFKPQLGLWRGAALMLILGCILVPTGVTLTLTQ